MAKMMIRWSKEDIYFLKKNYKKYGDTELAELLNENNHTFRIIDGKQVFRKFTKKHIEKKRSLLGLQRSSDEILKIKRRNNKMGRCGFTSDDNLWSRGIRISGKEGDMKTWGVWRYIRISNRWKLLHRHNWELKHGQIPKGFNIGFKDGNTLNCEPDNLYIISNEEMIKQNSASLRLTDGIIASYLCGRDAGIKELLLQNKPLLKLKRQQLLLNRAIKNEINRAEN